jgi:hypothetical protein
MTSRSSHWNLRLPWRTGAVGLLLAALALPAAAAEGTLPMQLNKLEPDGGACTAYLLLENRLGVALQALRVDIVLFDRTGVIARRLAVDVGALPEGKTSVRAFGVSGLACDAIGRVLLNDVITCTDGQGERTDCMTRIVTDSLAGVPFIQ